MKYAIFILLFAVYIEVTFFLPSIVRKEARETRRTVLELVCAENKARTRGPLHTYRVDLDDESLWVTNVVDDGEVVYAR